MVDAWSSLGIKRLIYRGFLQIEGLCRCRTGEGFECKKARGNVDKRMRSVAIVESPAGEPQPFYPVAIESNVLKKNTAAEHLSLATRLRSKASDRGRLLQNNRVQLGNEVLEPLAAGRALRQRNSDIGAAGVLDNGAVRMPVAPRA